MGTRSRARRRRRRRRRLRRGRIAVDLDLAHRKGAIQLHDLNGNVTPGQLHCIAFVIDTHKNADGVAEDCAGGGRKANGVSGQGWRQGQAWGQISNTDLDGLEI